MRAHGHCDRREPMSKATDHGYAGWCKSTLSGDLRCSISNLRSSLAPTVRQGTGPLRIQGGIKCPTHYPRQGMNPIQYDSCIGYTARVA